MNSRSISIEKRKKCLAVEIQYPESTTEILLKIESDRNIRISKFSDQSEHAGAATMINQEFDCEMWFPVVDVKIVPAMYGEIEVSGQKEGAEYTFNAWLWPDSEEVENTLQIKAERLVEWENGLFFNKKELTVSSFSLYVKVPVPLTMTHRIQHEISLLSEEWSGKITGYYKRGAEYILIGEERVEPEIKTRAVRGAAELSRDLLLEALKGNLEYILASQIQSDNNPLSGGFYLFYDLDAKTYRLPAWLWGWGPAIRALLESSHIPEITEVFTAQALIEAAGKAGTATLKGQVFHDNPEFDGLSTARWDPNMTMATGYRQRVCSASDSGFLCGWAWSALYRETGEQKYLAASLKYAKHAGQLVEKYGIPPQDYMPEVNAWTAHTLDESGFGVKAFDELYTLTGDEKFKETGKRYIDRHIEKFERADGLWERSYFRANDYLEPGIFMTRGLGWAMEGLVSAYHLTGEQIYLEKSCKMAEYLLDKQNEDGSWNFMLNKTTENVGIEDKGTPLWSLLLYRLHEFSKDKRHLEGARKALKWCIENQLTEGEAECMGGVIGSNPQSAVVYRPWYPLTCFYTSGFFALAILEEWKRGDIV